MTERTVLLYGVGMMLSAVLSLGCGWLLLTLGASDWCAVLAGTVAGGIVSWRVYRWHEHCDQVEQEARESSR